MVVQQREVWWSDNSVANVSQIVRLDRGYLARWVSGIRSSLMAQVEAGLKLVLDL